MPDGRWSARTTSYDALGRKTAVSEPGSPGRVTQYLSYDPFGRPGTIRPPEGADHDVTLSYGGVQTVTRTVRVGSAWNGAAVTESPATTTETYDRFGRLASVTEPSGTGGANTTTGYSYDSASRLTGVSTSSAGVTQTRTTSYDPRGFLSWESYPERGANTFGLGHGVDYVSYDSRGHAHRRIEGGNDLSFTFDSAERLRVIYLTGRASSCSPGSSSCIKELTYDTTALGKLYQASRFNHITLGGAAHVSKIAYTYFYNGPDGRISQRDLQHTFDGVVDNTKEAFTQSWSYTPLGLVDTESYPACQAGFTLCANVTPRAVQNVYTNGFLTAVPNYTGTAGIQYYPNGMVSQVSHANGVTAVYGNDPYGRPRPSSITVTGPAGTLWSSGNYAYDGAGNVTQVGHGYYLYDGVSRLTNAVVETNAVDAASGNALTGQSASYDAFGNLQGFSNRSTPTDQTTNRLLGGTYGSAGNLRAWNGATYDYDELDQLQHYVNGTQEWLYMYDADDERVWSFQPGSGGNPRFDRWTLRSLDNKVKRDFELSGYGWANWTAGNVWEDYLYRDGLLLAGYLSTGLRRHMDLDHLGTVRLLTNTAGGTTSFHAFLPYGEEATAFNQDTERMKYTGHERDLADLNGPGDDLDYMHARAYNPLVGRFLSIDPRGIDLPDSPQTLNSYAYVAARPLTFNDPTGKIAIPFVLAYIFSYSEDITVTAVGTLYNPATGVVGLESLIQGGNALRSVSDFSFDVSLRKLRSFYERRFTEMAVEGNDLAAFIDYFGLEYVLPKDKGDAAAMLAMAFIPELKLDVLAEDLIKGSLKASPSYRSELAGKTYREILELAKGKGPEAQAAKQMKKLIEQSPRLLGKKPGRF